MNDTSGIKIGARITFRAVTRHSDRPATRKVLGIDAFGRPLVRYHGTDCFVVRLHEVIAVEGGE